MTHELKKNLVNIANSGTNQERMICQKLLDNPGIKFKNIVDFSKKLKCSNSSVTRLTRSLGYPSFQHFLQELLNSDSTNLIHQNNDAIWYLGPGKEIAKLITGKLYIFSSRRGKSIAKFLSERLNTYKYPNEYYHESWGRTPKEESELIEEIDTAILITLNASSNLGNIYLDKLIEAKNVKKIIVITANTRLRSHEKVHHYSLSKIDRMNYEVETFDGYNFASSRIIALIVAILKELHVKKY